MILCNRSVFVGGDDYYLARKKYPRIEQSIKRKSEFMLLELLPERVKFKYSDINAIPNYVKVVGKRDGRMETKTLEISDQSLHIGQVVRIIPYRKYEQYNDRLESSYYFGRVVRKCNDLFLVSLYEDDSNLLGAMVINFHNQLIAIVSNVPYKQGTHSAFYVVPTHPILQIVDEM